MVFTVWTMRPPPIGGQAAKRHGRSARKNKDTKYNPMKVRRSGTIAQTGEVLLGIASATRHQYCILGCVV